jgi:hypothetical protein
MNQNRSLIRVWAAIAVLAIPAHALEAAEPQAHFSLKQGWVEMTLRQADQPVPGATVRVLDANTAQFSEGETNAAGKTEFPIPRGPGFIVEIHLGEREADLIWIERTTSGIEPENLLLSFGLHPCCRMPTAVTVSQPVGDVPAASRWPFLIKAVGASLLAISGLLVLAWSRRTIKVAPTLPAGDLP